MPTVTVILGLAVAVLADRLRPRGEKLSKTIIFLPMAISMVGAATIWRFVYEARRPASRRSGCRTHRHGARLRPGRLAAEDTLHLNSFCSWSS